MKRALLSSSKCMVCSIRDREKKALMLVQEERHKHLPHSLLFGSSHSISLSLPLFFADHNHRNTLSLLFAPRHDITFGINSSLLLSLCTQAAAYSLYFPPAEQTSNHLLIIRHPSDELRASEVTLTLCLSVSCLHHQI